MADVNENIINQLSDDISASVGNNKEDELDSISSSFNKTLIDALHAFNSNTFDDDGFIKKMGEIDLPDKQDKETVKNVLNTMKNDYVSADTLNQSEILMRRDIQNIVEQMPEMHDAVNVVRDAIIECNVATGEVSRSIVFQNHEDEEALETQTKELEAQHDLLIAVKNFIVPKTLMHGEMYIQVVPYAKLFAELELISDNRNNRKPVGHHDNYNSTFGEAFHRSIPPEVASYFKESTSLYSEENVRFLTESLDMMTSVDSTTDKKIETGDSKKFTEKSVNTEIVGDILKNINVYNGSSVEYAELGENGLRELLMKEYKEHKVRNTSDSAHFMEAQVDYSKANGGTFANIDQDNIDFSSYSDIKGCYVKYLDGLRMVPIRMDRRVIGYYYVSTTMDLQSSAAKNPNGIIDMSYQNYMRDRNMVDRLADIIIKSFDKKMLEKNIKLKNEIAEIIMSHKFAEGKLSFIYIPENEVVRLVINEDENGKGHSILEPSIFPARMYLMLTLYNMLFILNNNTTRVHYLKSSGLNKDYASQIQRTMRKFQQRRITIDDIYSYSGVLNKIGGMGEMILPSGRNDFKALETDTIAAVDNPFSIEFLEQQRREAISGTGVPHLLVINAIDEVDFAKTLEMANARFLSTVGSYKIDFNRGITKLYQAILKASTDMEPEVIQSFRFQFNTAKQQELSINADMIQNFNSMIELVESLYFGKADLEDKDGNPTPKRMHLRKELAMEYLPQLDFDVLDDIVKRVNLDATEDDLQAAVKKLDITDEDLKQAEE